MQFFKKELKPLKKFKNSTKKVSLFFKKALLGISLTSCLLNTSCFRESDSILIATNNQKKPKVILNYKEQRVALYDSVEKKYIVIDSSIKKLRPLPGSTDSTSIFLVSIPKDSLQALIAMNDGSGWVTYKFSPNQQVANSYSLSSIEANNGEKKVAVINFYSHQNQLILNSVQLLSIGKNSFTIYNINQNTKTIDSITQQVNINDIFVGQPTLQLVQSQEKWILCPFNYNNSSSIVNGFYLVDSGNIKVNIVVHLNNSMKAIQSQINLNQPTKIEISDDRGKKVYFELKIVDLRDFLPIGILGSGENQSYFLQIDNVSLNGEKLQPPQQTKLSNNKKEGFNFANSKNQLNIIIDK
ncbi:MAG: hypothetical protein QXH71_01940 [Candidatus Anstonellaceae archaeon]